MEQRNVVEAQTSPTQETSHQVSGIDREPFLRFQCRNTPVQCLYDSHKKQPEIEETNADTTANHSEVEKNSLNKITTSHTEQKVHIKTREG